MQRDKIIEVSTQAGFSNWEDGELHSPYVEGTDLPDLLEAVARLAAAKEREACLKIAESMSLTSANMNKTWRTGCRDVAEAIKARGEA